MAHVSTVLTRVCACSDEELKALLAAHGLLDGSLALVAEGVELHVKLCRAAKAQSNVRVIYTKRGVG